MYCTSGQRKRNGAGAERWILWMRVRDAARPGLRVRNRPNGLPRPVATAPWGLAFCRMPGCFADQITRAPCFLDQRDVRKLQRRDENHHRGMLFTMTLL